MLRCPQMAKEAETEKAVLINEKGQDYPLYVLWFAHLLARPDMNILQIDYRGDTNIQLKRNRDLRRQLQPAFDRLVNDPDFNAGIDLYREELMNDPLFMGGTCSFELNSEQREQLLSLLERNGGNVNGTRPKRIRTSIAI